MHFHGNTAVDLGAVDRDGTDAEKRTQSRKRVLKEGKVILSDWAAIDCTIRDVSVSGARLVFGGPTTLPKSFWLLMVSAGKLVPAEPAWQRGLAAGVRFTGPERPAPPRKW